MSSSWAPSKSGLCPSSESLKPISAIQIGTKFEYVADALRTANTWVSMGQEMKEGVLQTYTGMSVAKFQSTQPVLPATHRELFQYAVLVYHPLWHAASHAAKIARIGEAVAMHGPASSDSRLQLGAVLYMCCNALSNIHTGENQGRGCSACRLSVEPASVHIISRADRVTAWHRGATLLLGNSPQALSQSIQQFYGACSRDSCFLTIAFVSAWLTFMPYSVSRYEDEDAIAIASRLSCYLPAVLLPIILSYYEGMAREVVEKLAACNLPWWAESADKPSKKRRIMPSGAAAAAAAAAASGSNS